MPAWIESLGQNHLHSNSQIPKLLPAWSHHLKSKDKAIGPSGTRNIKFISNTKCTQQHRDLEYLISMSGDGLCGTTGHNNKLKTRH